MYKIIITAIVAATAVAVTAITFACDKQAREYDKKVNNQLNDALQILDDIVKDPLRTRDMFDDDIHNTSSDPEIGNTLKILPYHHN